MHGDWSECDSMTFPDIEEEEFEIVPLDRLVTALDDPDPASFRWVANSLFRRGVKFAEMMDYLEMSSEQFHKIYNRNLTFNQKIRNMICSQKPHQQTEVSPKSKATILTENSSVESSEP